MEVLRLPGYTDQEKVNIAEKFLIPKKMQEHGLVKKNLEFGKQVLEKVIREYTREAGVRNLEREIATLCRKVVMQVVKQGKKFSLKLAPALLHKYLGIPKFQPTETLEKLAIGVAVGMAWTEFGGELLYIEVTAIAGTGKLVPTGQLGDVMKESAQAAMTYVRSRAEEFGLKKNFYQKMDIHIHIPEGAVPKDGPSAGIAMAVALISALTKMPVKHGLTMTGELTLTGKVLPIGGLKEKILAAHRTGMTNVILPKDNEKDLQDIPANVRKAITFHPSGTIDEVIQIAFGKKFKLKGKTRKAAAKKSKKTAASKRPSVPTFN
jgi:ATP-dependent Lon protease